jgi:hypothetical protein
MIANPPIIFGKTAQLLCAPVTPNISSITSNVTAWLGGKDYSILIYNGGNADRPNMKKFRDGREANLNPFFRYTNLMKWMKMWTIRVQSASLNTEKGCH